MDEPEFLKQLGDEARRDGVPIIKPETAALLKTLLAMKKPVNVLEVGTAVGYSAILMSLYIPEGAKITTIENYEKRIGPARNNIRAAGKESVITLLEGDAMEILPGLMPPKRVVAHISAAQAEIMVQETCIAETIHASLSLLGLYLPRLWPGPGGILVCVLYVLLGNVPFILIQRFNRPKLRMLLDKCRRAEAMAAARQAAQ